MNKDFNDVKVHELVGEEQTALVHHYQKSEDGVWYEIFGENKKIKVSSNRIYALLSSPYSNHQIIECSVDESVLIDS